ncbi:hypothetical protein BH10PSE9_BH10PSE9_21110 [soil metagenome]
MTTLRLRIPPALAPEVVATAAVTIGLALLWQGGVTSWPTLTTGAGKLDGAWLSTLVVRLAAALPWPLQTTLAVLSLYACGFLLAWLYKRLVYNDWPVVEALIFVGGMAANAFLIGSIASDRNAIPVMIAFIAIIPGMRRLESVGDVQANMSFGLVLPLLFLAGPALAPLVPLLALFGALSDREARRDWRAFVAMYLVAVMPTLLVIAGLVGMVGGGEALRLLNEVYLPAFTPRGLEGDSLGQVLATTARTILPFGIVPVAYMFYRDRRWQPWSAAAVFVLPLFLVAGRILFSWPMAPLLPTVAFLGAFASWLSVARLSVVFRRVSLALVLLSTALSWSLTF